ncbi:Cof-type HAD-IIB family hydrolase [Paenibacillus nicotianae]|uniref:Cof-type HAD-IIB family hydrolase n=1 Tax=Paenibacillus nicotianae TaxID=1526551 RepID=A0ABW4UW38_9BACL
MSMDESMRMPIRWIVSDLDGTLLDANQRISPYIQQRIRAFTANGGHFTLATGRSLISVQPFIELLHLTNPIILYNGAKIYDPLQACFLEEKFLSLSHVQWIFNHYYNIRQPFDLDLLLFYQEQIYCTRITPKIQRWIDKEQVEVQVVTLASLEQVASQITKMMLLGEPESLTLFQLQIEMLNTVKSEQDILEILPFGTSKGTALQQLITMTGSQHDEFLTVGDHLNDIEMIQLTRHGVAMQNAHPELKHVANWITAKTNNEDALIEVIDYVEQSWITQYNPVIR